jgi:hypothetical protein
LPGAGLGELAGRDASAPRCRTHPERSYRLSSDDDLAGRGDLRVRREIEHQGIGVIPGHGRNEIGCTEQHRQRFADHIGSVQVAGTYYLISFEDRAAETGQAAPRVEDFAAGINDVSGSDRHDSPWVPVQIFDLLADRA